MQPHFLGDAPGGAADSTGDMGAVSVAVLGAATIIDRGVANADTAAEVGMGRADAGVDDVGVNAASGGVVVVRGVQRQGALVATIQAPSGVLLGAPCEHLAIFLDVGHARVRE